MKREIEKDLIEIECAIKNQIEKDDIHTMSILKKCYKLVSELKKYEDLEEQGKLIKLPCEIGRRVYMIYQLCKGATWEIEEHKIRLEDLENIGKTVFITREEANKAIDKILKTESNKGKPHHCKLCGSYIEENNLSVCNKCASEYQY